MTMAEKTSFKRGATDFSSQMAKLKAAECDMVVLGTIIRETIGGIGTARKLGYNPVFLGSSAAYTDLIHKLGGKAMDGLYATMTVQNPYTDEASQPIRFWANKYKTKFNEDPTVFSVYGYDLIDAFLQAAQKAGPNLSTDSFIKTMDTMKIPPDIFGSAEATFGHLLRARHHRHDGLRQQQVGAQGLELAAHGADAALRGGVADQLGCGIGHGRHRLLPGGQRVGMPGRWRHIVEADHRQIAPALRPQQVPRDEPHRVHIRPRVRLIRRHLLRCR